jgi:hypothetical protein
MLGLKWLAWANATTFACGRISFASRLAVPMTRGLSRGLPLFEARSPLCHCFGRCFDGGVVATFRPRIMRYHIIEKELCCASQQNWPAHVRFGFIRVGPTQPTASPDVRCASNSVQTLALQRKRRDVPKADSCTASHHPPRPLTFNFVRFYRRFRGATVNRVRPNATQSVKIGWQFGWQFFSARISSRVAAAGLRARSSV